MRWGVPEFVREHVTRNGLEGYVGGYFVGSEHDIPALDYFTAVKEPWAVDVGLRAAAFPGKLRAPLDHRRRPMRCSKPSSCAADGRSPARAPARAYALASATQLRVGRSTTHAGTSRSTARASSRYRATTKYISVDQLIRQPVMDPDYVSVADFVDATRRGVTTVNVVTPPALADRLERDNREALLVAGIDAKGDASLRYEVADVETWAHLGLHLAEKLRGAVRAADLPSRRWRGGEGARRCPPGARPRPLGRGRAHHPPPHPRHEVIHDNHNFSTGQPPEPVSLGADPGRGRRGRDDRPYGPSGRVKERGTRIEEEGVLSGGAQGGVGVPSLRATA